MTTPILLVYIWPKYSHILEHKTTELQQQDKEKGGN
jgi:hypothetical protein